MPRRRRVKRDVVRCDGYNMSGASNTCSLEYVECWAPAVAEVRIDQDGVVQTFNVCQSCLDRAVEDGVLISNERSLVRPRGSDVDICS